MNYILILCVSFSSFSSVSVYVCCFVHKCHMIIQSVNIIDDICYFLSFGMVCIVIFSTIRVFLPVVSFCFFLLSWFVCFRNCIHSFFSIKKNTTRDEKDQTIEMNINVFRYVEYKEIICEIKG
jgi:hypothetical protein